MTAGSAFPSRMSKNSTLLSTFLSTKSTFLSTLSMTKSMFLSMVSMVRLLSRLPRSSKPGKAWRSDEVRPGRSSYSIATAKRRWKEIHFWILSMNYVCRTDTGGKNDLFFNCRTFEQNINRAKKSRTSQRSPVEPLG